jgi:uncharacterized SAM-binding protein YcdF (DUF218 family)
MPLSLILIGLLVAIFSKNTRTKKLSLRISLGLIFLFGNGFLINEAFLWWETPPISPDAISQPYDVGIILTGGMITNKQLSENQIFTDKTADRFIQPLRLYKMGKLKKILISGGSSDLKIMRQDVTDESSSIIGRIRCKKRGYNFGTKRKKYPRKCDEFSGNFKEKSTIWD